MEIVPGASADGILEVGDIIISTDNKQIRQYDELEGIVTAVQPGEEIHWRLLETVNSNKQHLPYSPTVSESRLAILTRAE
ncbi:MULTISPECIES: hypothetical protein [Paenibacillus]|uniref:PDZ domain-containing protein n=2 Tax=Paenibacillus lactis TaxID=228574 RepID=G4HNB1_9BACL|nr:hypothetical protein [Paenibacillus lactis]EHB54273.1 hypothetical protein PaelaDRAFT_5472 [Paenibacillus lactis 154]MBP1896263.1 PDZ domain-containing secreted protein [Paenibacillus lactis]MCM3497132.1 hypothetical protein [Paenibacillus lactis]GIO94037.1 hypothetical protein J31TS3_52640 [Paenibacillus lactis]